MNEIVMMILMNLMILLMQFGQNTYCME